MSAKVAFLGTGLMGAPMAVNLVRAGFEVGCYNRTASRTAPVVEAGGTAHPTPREAAAGAAFVVSIVTDGPDVEQVLFGLDGATQGAAPGALFIEMSTISPAVAQDLAGRAHQLGFRYLEAPVTGGTIGAQKGTLSILAGGNEADFAEAAPLFAALGQKATLCGGPGAGQGVKLCNQIMGALNLLGVCEALVLCRKMEIDGGKLVEALGAGAATSWALQNLAPKILAGDFAPGFMVDTQQKDMRLVAAAAEAADVALPGAALTTQLWRAAQAAGNGAEGIQTLYKVLESLAGLAPSTGLREDF